MAHAHDAPEGTGAACPVRRMEVDPRTAPASAEWNGVTVHFCNLRCRDRFLANPERFLPRERRKGSCCV